MKSFATDSVVYFITFMAAIVFGVEFGIYLILCGIFLRLGYIRNA